MKTKIKQFPKIQTIRQLVRFAVSGGPDDIAYEYREGEQHRRVTFGEFYRDVEALGAVLTDRGFGRAHIACVGENSYPWIVTYLTALMSGGVFVPLDRELPAQDLHYLLEESDAEILFCDRKRLDLLRGGLAEHPGLRAVVCFDLPAEEDGAESFSCLLSLGRNMSTADYDALRSDPFALKDLVFTSGTTGVAKGVMLTEHNLVSGVWYGLDRSRVSGRCLSVLPYHHTYEAVCDILVALFARVTLCINTSLRRVQEDMKFYRPDYIYLVPAFAAHFYDGIRRAVERSGKSALFARMIRFSRTMRKAHIDLRPILFRSVRRQFGGRLRRIVCGGAPIRPEWGQFFGDIGITLTGGYGITECSPLVSVNDDDETNNYASAGRRIACLSWRIAHPDADGIGEIQVQGDVVMKGYYKRPDLTAAVLSPDGWFSTGDFGYINDRDEIVITGRAKNIVVLNNGKNIYPEEIEAHIFDVPYISEAVVRGVRNAYGEEVALEAEVYIPEPEGRTEEQVLSDIRAALSDLPKYKQISRLVLRSEPFPKTTSNKIRRAV